MTWWPQSRPTIPVQVRSFPTLLLLLASLGSACQDSPSLVKEGALFATAEQAAPGKALVYVYWPREEQGDRSRLWVQSCKGMSGEVQPGGYTALTVEPGLSCFDVEMHSTFAHMPNATVTEHLSSMKLNAEAGQTLFIRLVKEPGLIKYGIVPRLTEAATAEPEIKRCRRSIPLTPEEMLQEYLRKEGHGSVSGNQPPHRGLGRPATGAVPA